MIFDEFDGIHASDEIKQKTLHNVMKQRSRKKRTGMTAALTLCVTCLLVVLFQPWRLMEASPAPAPAPTLAVYSYVTLDINPSMEWKLDEQQRVVRVTAYNKDADNILTELQLEGERMIKQNIISSTSTPLVNYILYPIYRIVNLFFKKLKWQYLHLPSVIHFSNFSILMMVLVFKSK